MGLFAPTTPAPAHAHAHAHGGPHATGGAAAPAGDLLRLLGRGRAALGGQDTTDAASLRALQVRPYLAYLNYRDLI